MHHLHQLKIRLFEGREWPLLSSVESTISPEEEKSPTRNDGISPTVIQHGAVAPQISARKQKAQKNLKLLHNQGLLSSATSGTKSSLFSSNKKV